MSESRAATSGVVGVPAPLAVVAELDAAEREAIELGDWTRLGDVLDQQQELWQRLMESARHGDGATPAEEAAAAMRYLYHVRRRNHQLIAAQADAFHQRLTGVRCGQVDHAAFSDVTGPSA